MYLEKHHSGAWHITFLTTPFDTEGVNLVLCRNFRRISLHLQLFYSDTCCNLPPMGRGLRLSYSLLYYLYRDMNVTDANPLRLTVHGILKFLHEAIGRNKATIRGSCYHSPPNIIPTRKINNRSASFTFCFTWMNVINRRTTTKRVLCGRWSLASNSKFSTISIDAGEGDLRR